MSTIIDWDQPNIQFLVNEDKAYYFILLDLPLKSMAIIVIMLILVHSMDLGIIINCNLILMHYTQC